MTMVSCPEEGRLRAYLDGELAGAEREAVVRHLDGRAECAGRAGALVETGGAGAGLLLRHGGLSYAEIAAALDVAPGSVGTILARAEREFRCRYLELAGEPTSERLNV